MQTNTEHALPSANNTKPAVLARGTILVKRLPLMNAIFEVMGTSGHRVTMRRIDGDKRLRAESFEVDASHLQKNGYLLESEAGPHPLEAESKMDRKIKPRENNTW